ncbi:WD40/YVTN/BNR-like repeat-containing protein [Chryseobacterium sp. SIMBA_038]|uniref:WD40/YVTN/BNR-like repeat-containing protein n=1 Tax=Chryseobacterium sp. SIMBA_038 TaxID=3085780 RepID=UPI00397AA795
MKKLLPFLFSFLGILTFSQQVESLTTILNDKISIRALELYDGKVWYSGTDSKFGFVDLKNFNNQKQIKLSEKKLQFRTLAQNKESFFAINIESPAYFFKIDKKDLVYKIVHTDTTKTAFYDALLVYNKFGIAFGDPDPTQKLNLAFSVDGGSKWTSCDCKNWPKLEKGEAAFAASNTNISNYAGRLWIATGGKKSRIYKKRAISCKWDVYETPFIQGESSQGIYSIDFGSKKFGVAVGGDYTKQDANANNIATTIDGGKTWQIQASGKNAGYTTCVKIKPNSKGKEIISIGDQHISYSSDFGKTWNKISDEKGFFVCKWVDENTVILAGKDKISLLKLKF